MTQGRARFRPPPGLEDERNACFTRPMDLFPLPLFGVATESRTQRRRNSELRLVTRMANEAVKALNFLSGTADASHEATSCCSSLQSDVCARVWESAASWPKPGADAPSNEAALKKLLRGNSPYCCEGASTKLASFQQQLVALPSTLVGAPMIDAVLPSDAAHYLERNLERMLRTDDAAIYEAASFTPYNDPRLRGRRRHRFVRKLARLGLVGYTRSPRGRVGVFCVEKKGGQQRLIVDARGVNLLFRKPPRVQLCSSEALSRIEIFLSKDPAMMTSSDAAWIKQLLVYVGVADVDNCFHRLRAPKCLAEFFCLDDVAGEDVGMVGTMLDGEAVLPGERLSPMWLSLAMGFSWSLYFAQMIGEHGVDRLGSLHTGLRIQDVGAPLIFRPEGTWHLIDGNYVYVDNLSFIGTNPIHVDDSLKKMVDGMNELGMTTHEEAGASTRL